MLVFGPFIWGSALVARLMPGLPLVHLAIDRVGVGGRWGRLAWVGSRRLAHGGRMLPPRSSRGSSIGAMSGDMGCLCRPFPPWLHASLSRRSGCFKSQEGGWRCRAMIWKLHRSPLGAFVSFFRRWPSTRLNMPTWEGG